MSTNDLREEIKEYRALVKAKDPVVMEKRRLAMGGQLGDYIDAPTKYNHTAMMEGPTRKIKVFNDENSLRQIGWLGATGTFYPWPSHPTRDQEPGSFSPIYMEIGD